MERGETAAGELRATKYKWGCKYVARREITEWAIQKDSEAETKDMGETARIQWRGNPKIG